MTTLLSIANIKILGIAQASHFTCFEPVQTLVFNSNHTMFLRYTVCLSMKELSHA